MKIGTLYSQTSSYFHSLSEVTFIWDLHHIAPYTLVVLGKNRSCIVHFGRTRCRRERRFMVSTPCRHRCTVPPAILRGFSAKVISAFNHSRSQRLSTECSVQHAESDTQYRSILVKSCLKQCEAAHIHTLTKKNLTKPFWNIIKWNPACPHICMQMVAITCCCIMVT